MILVKQIKTKEEETLLRSMHKAFLEDKKYLLFLSLGLFVVYTFLYGIWKIPVVGFGINRLSAITFSDYLFIIAITILAAAFIALWRYERKHHVSSHSAVGGFGGGIAGIVAGICPVCQSIGIVGLGSTLLNIPTAYLSPYLGIIKVLSLGLLGLAVFLKADSIHTKACCSCITSPHKNANYNLNDPILFRNDYLLGGIVFLVFLLFINQMLIPQAYASVLLGGGEGTVSLGSFEYGSKITLKPMPLAVGEQPKIAGYKTIVKPLPTISELAIKPSNGDAVQDLLNNIVPTGTPWYGQRAGVTFDDPIAAQNIWGSYERSIQLDSAQQERWNRIANSFTCDYCCGSPQNPTIITRCGCAHAKAARGMAKWFVRNYGDSYSDEEIYGEMARWYALWYPKGTIERIIQESQD